LYKLYIALSLRASDDFPFDPHCLGSLAHSVTDHAVSLCGASGGCYALIGAHIASIITVSYKHALIGAHIASIITVSYKHMYS
jgi:hypothetical protein